MSKWAIAIWAALFLSLYVYAMREHTFGPKLVVPALKPAHCPAGYVLGMDHGLKSSPGDEEVYRPWCFDKDGNGARPIP